MQMWSALVFVVLGCSVAQPVRSPATEPREPSPTRDEVEEPNPADAVLNVAATRAGEMGLHPMADGTLLVSAGVELLVAEPGKPLQRHPERLLGLEPPGVDQRWTVIAVGGHWPDATYMVLNEFAGCVDPVDRAYRWAGDRWQLVTPQTDDVALTFAEFHPYAGTAVLAQSVWTLNSKLGFRYSCSDEMPAALREKLRKPRARYHVLRPGEPPRPMRELAGQGLITRDAGDTFEQLLRPHVRLVSTPTGDVFALVSGSLLHVEPGGTRSRRLPHVLRDGNLAKIVHVDGSDVYVATERPLALARFGSDGWAQVEVPNVTALESIAGGRDRSLWITTVTSVDEDHPDERTLWRRHDDAWERVALPLVAIPPSTKDPEWNAESYVMLDPEWTEDPNAVALDPWRVAQSGDSVWVLGYVPAGGPGASAIFTTDPVHTTLVVPDYVQQRYDVMRRDLRETRAP